MLGPTKLDARARRRSESHESTASEGLETRRLATLAFNEALRDRSSEAALIMTNLPLPKFTDGTAEYMEHLEMLTEDCPRVLLIAGQRDAEVITMYS